MSDKEEEKVPWLVYKIAKDCNKEECKCCGYFWGPKHPRAGQRATWTVKEEKQDEQS